MFDKDAYDGTKWIFYIDLDMIITGNLDDLVTLNQKVKDFTLATLSTNEIFCENASDGYNSSIVLFRSTACHALYSTLVRHYDTMLRYLMRFDHYLEMCVWNATLFQVELPG